MARKIALSCALLLLAATAFCQYQYWANYCNTSYLQDLAFTATDIWCLANSPLRIDRATGQITQLTHADSPLPQNRFTAVATDPASNVWLLLDHGGLLKYDGTNWTLFEPDFTYYEFNCLAVAGINDIWLGSYYGLVHFDGSTFTDFGEFDQLSQICVDHLGRVWFWAEVGDIEFRWDVLVCWDGENFEFNFQMPDTIVGNAQIAFDASNNLWAGTAHYGLAQWTGDSWTYLNTENSGLLSDEIRCLAFDAAGTLWAATSDGISSFDGVTWTNFTEQNSAWGDRYPYQLKIADDQSVWLATDDGLVKVSGGVLSTVDTSLGGYPTPYYSIMSQALAPDGYWRFLIYGGIYQFNAGIWTRMELPVADFGAKSILYDASGKLWVNGSAGLLCFDGSTWTHYTTQNSGLPNNVCKTLALDHAQRLWIGTLNGLACFDGATWQVYTSSNAPFPTNEFSLVRCDLQGRIWCTSVWTFDSWGGAAIWDGQSWTWLPIPEFGDNTYYVSDIDFLGNAAYFSTGGGLAKLEDGTWTFYTAANSNIPSGWLSWAATDSYGNLWLSGPGLTRFNGTAFRNYRVANSGLASEPCTILQIDSQDRIWISCGIWSYLSVFDYGQAVPATDPVAPSTLTLKAWPNPFRDNVSLEIQLDRSLELEVAVFNLRGQRVKTVRADLGAGKNILDWDGKDEKDICCAAGIYLIKARGHGFERSAKVLLLK